MKMSYTYMIVKRNSLQNKIKALAVSDFRYTNYCRRLLFVDKKLKQIESAIGRRTNPFGNYKSYSLCQNKKHQY